jgi:tetratricopeptide (TPR) repeat protein
MGHERPIVAARAYARRYARFTLQCLTLLEVAMQRSLWVLLPLLCYFLPAAAAAPTRAQIVAWCNDSNPELRIRGCSALIQSGKEPAKVLAGSFFNRGNAYEAKGQYDLAIQDFDSAIKRNPNDAAAFYSRGSSYFAKGQTDSAIQDFDRAIMLDPNDATAFNNRGEAYREKGQQDRAIQDFDRAITLKPNYANAFNNRGAAYLAKRQTERAIQDFDSAIRLNPNFADAFSNRGAAYLVKNQADLAINDFDQVIKLNPRDAVAFYFRSVAKQNTGDANGTAQDLAAAKAIDPDIANKVGHQGFTP